MVVELSGRDGLKTNALNKRTVDDTINIRQRHNKGLRLAHLTESILKGRTARLAAEEHLEKKKKKKKEMGSKERHSDKRPPMYNICMIERTPFAGKGVSNAHINNKETYNFSTNATLVSIISTLQGPKSINRYKNKPSSKLSPPPQIYFLSPHPPHSRREGNSTPSHRGLQSQHLALQPRDLVFEIRHPRARVGALEALDRGTAAYERCVR